MRVTCYRCFRPKPLCWCDSITPMQTRTRFVFLTHPKEFKHEKAATGRLTHLCLARSEIVPGIAFDSHETVQEIIRDPRHFCVLLHPGREALDLSAPLDACGARKSRLDALAREVESRILVVFLIDATWALGRKILRLSPGLQHLPRIMFTPSAPSRYVIKQQPHPGCLSTLEATHELLIALQRLGLDEYPLPEQLPALFHRMQDFQLRCAADPARGGYRRKAYTPPAQRAGFRGRSASRRSRLFAVPEPSPAGR